MEFDTINNIWFVYGDAKSFEFINPDTCLPPLERGFIIRHHIGRALIKIKRDDGAVLFVGHDR